VVAAKRGAPAASVDLLRARAGALNVPAGAIVTWVPAHPRRAWLRPDAGRALAEAFSDLHGLPVRPLLRRRPWGRRQAGQAAEARRSAPERLGFVLRRPALEGPVVLVDDVRTTGATLDHVAALLIAAGASEVVGVVVAQARET
jgi:predicted amidophosphoribosyltransferase